MAVGQRQYRGIQLAPAYLVHQHMGLLLDDAEAEIRVVAPDRGQHLGQQVWANRRNDTHAQGITQGLLAGLGEAIDVLQLNLDRRCPRQDFLSRGRYQHLLVVALEQLRAELCLQLGNGGAQGRLGNRALLRRFLEVAGIGNRRECSHRRSPQPRGHR